MEEISIKFDGTIRYYTGSYSHVLKPEVIKEMNLKEGDETQYAVFKGKKGKFIAIWKKENRK